MKRLPVIINLTFTLLFIILLFIVLIEARGFLYPLALGIFFAYLLYPIASFLEKKGFPRILANFVTIILGLTALAGVIIFIYSQLRIFAEDFPQMKDQALANVYKFENYIQDALGIPIGEQNGWARDLVVGLLESGGNMLQSIFAATAGTVFTIGILPVYVFFLLYYRNKFKEFLRAVVPDEKHDKIEIIILKISLVVKHYMSGIFLVVFILCFLNSIGLLIVGIEYAILFGIISAFFNLIPYFGTLIGGSIPFLFTLLTYDSPRYAFGVLILFIILQFTENNILTPNITGGNVDINPFITILSLILGGMVWGVPGMFMIIPIIGVLKIVCDNIESLKPYAYLIGTSGTERHAITIRDFKSIFAKLRRRF